MNWHHRWARFAVLGNGYALLGVVLVVQEVAGCPELGLMLPGRLVLIGLLSWVQRFRESTIAWCLTGGRRVLQVHCPE